MLRVRLLRRGRKHRPSYNVVVVDSHKKCNGAYIERLGTYNPSEKEALVSEELLVKWKGFGAKITGAARKVIREAYKGKRS